MNELEKKLRQYEEDAIAYETGRSKVAPNIFIFPSECLILLNIKNTALAQLRAELDEWENAKKFVADGCEDEVHCGCVPILRRELDEARKMAYQAYWNRDDTYRILSAYMDAHPEETK